MLKMLDIRQFVDYVYQKNSFKAAMTKYNVSVNDGYLLIHKCSDDTLNNKQPLTYEIFMEIIEFINEYAPKPDNNVSYDGLYYSLNLYSIVNNKPYFEFGKFIKYKYIIRNLLSDQIYDIENLFTDDQLKIIFSIYGEWLLKSTRRSLFKHITVLNIFEDYINSKDLDFVVNMASTKNCLANTIYTSFYKKLNKKQKKKIISLKILYNLSK